MPSLLPEPVLTNLAIANLDDSHADNFDKLEIVRAHSTAELAELSGMILAELKDVREQCQKYGKGHSLGRYQSIEKAARRTYAIAVACHTMKRESLPEEITAIKTCLEDATSATMPIDSYDVFPKSIPLVAEMNIRVYLAPLIEGVLQTVNHAQKGSLPTSFKKVYLPFCDPRYDLYSTSTSALVDHGPGNTPSPWTTTAQDLVDVISRNRRVKELVNQGYSRRALLDFTTKVLDNIHGIARDHLFGQRIRQLCFKLSVQVARVDGASVLDGIIIPKPEQYSFTGGYADIYKGEFNSQSVAIKRFRVDGYRDTLALQRALLREISAWKELDHPNILPFLGVEAQNFANEGRPMGMVSPWMDHTLLEYTSCFEPNIDVLNQMVHGTACGIEHLHRLGVVHADIKCKNILYNEEDYQPRLADFGLVGYGNATEQVRPSESGSTDFMAPELLLPGHFRRTTSSDVFAFACTIVEAYLGQHPYDAKVNRAQRGVALANAVRPMRPNGDYGLRMGDDDMWGLVESMWKDTPADRPTLEEVLRDMARFKHVKPAPK